MKKFLSVFLCAVLFCGILSACGDGRTGSSTQSNAGNTTGTDSGAASGEAAAATAREETVHLVMCFLNWVGAMDNTQNVVDAMNEITLESHNITVELQIMDSASYSQQMTLMLAGGEQVDLFNAIGVEYNTVINSGYVLDLEENDLLQTYGQGIIDTMGEIMIDACRFGGVLYGLPGKRDMALGLNTYAIGSQYLDGIGYEYSSDNVIYTTQEDIEDILSRLHETYPNLDVIIPQTTTLRQSVPYDQLGSDIYGVLLVYGQNLTVEDLFSSDEYYEYTGHWYNWQQLGYVSGDALTNDIAATTQVRSGSAISYQTATKPGIKAQEGNLCGQEMVVLQVGEDFLRSSAPASMPWCISINTVDEVAAMEYLNELYTNAELSTLLCWGIEGEEFQYTEDGHITYADGVTADTSGYLHSVNWEMPNQFIAGVFEGDDLDLWDQTENFNNEATNSKAIGFTFDNSSVSTEYTAIHNIYTEYQKQLEFGFTDPEIGIPEMLERMEAAGLSEYMAEKQRQLDEWAASQTEA